MKRKFSFIHDSIEINSAQYNEKWPSIILWKDKYLQLFLFTFNKLIPQTWTLQSGGRNIILIFFQEFHTIQFFPEVTVNDFAPIPIFCKLLQECRSKFNTGISRQLTPVPIILVFFQILHREQMLIFRTWKLIPINFILKFLYHGYSPKNISIVWDFFPYYYWCDKIALVLNVTK